jgi:GT2 family glycosyltransferase
MTLDLAIVIPVGPGDTSWRALLPQLATLYAREIHLVFARGDQQIVKIESVEGVVVHHVEAGRAKQLNGGAQSSVAAWLWFLHADSQLSTTTGSVLAAHVGNDPKMLGYFDLRFLNDGPRLMWLNTLGAWLRSRVFGLPFGDQGFLMSRELFIQLGGFNEGLRSGEDHALVWRAKQQGAEIRSLRAPLYTSARKYAQHGWWATTQIHLRSTWQQARRFAKQAAS